MFGLSPQQWIGIGLLVAYALWRLWPMLPTFRLPSLGGTPAAPTLDTDTLDFQALKRLQSRFERQKCKDGKAAIDTALSHFFHAEG